QNYRHMELAREIGVGPEALRARFPKIAYTHLNAYGNLGVWRDRPGFEQVVQAVSGIQMTYGRGGKPKLMPTPVIDIGSGLLGAFGTLLGLYQQLKTGESVVASTHLTRTSVLFQVEPIAETQRQRCLETARSRGLEVDDDPGRRVVAGILRALDTFICVAGPRSDVETWLQSAGLAGSSAPEADNPLDHVPWSVMTRSMAHWRGTVAAAGLADTVAVVPVPKMKRMIAEFPPSPDRTVPMVSRRAYAGVDAQLTFIANPIRMWGTPLVDVSPAPMRGEHTTEVLGQLGLRVPEDGGVIEYPAAKPLLVWLATLVRWGYFAWRSGNI
ncbi:MAG: CoA transferase, partial [Deltaproteobacteria bacterium]|nr:CoA transferase [Deltaproteobacteria bacterium]